MKRFTRNKGTLCLSILAVSIGCISCARNNSRLVYRDTVEPELTPTSSRPVSRVYAEPDFVVSPAATIDESGEPILVPEESATDETETLSGAVKRILSDNPDVDATNVRASVRHGILILTGRARSETERQEIHNQLASIPGVDRVDDKLEVDSAR